METQLTMFNITGTPAPATRRINSDRLDVVAVQLVKERKVSYDAERLTAPEQAASAFRSMVGHLDREVFAVLILDGRNRITSIHQVSQGSLNQSVVHPREVFKAAILANAAALILVHNHPTGDTAPSQEDRAITQRLKEAGDILSIKILDHVIVDTESDAFFSFANSGII